MKKHILILLAGFLCLGMASCGNNDDAITKNGVIKYFPPPDSCDDYIIVIEGQLYKPKDLQEEFKQDNLSVKVTYTITDEKHNCGFGGYKPIINILKIKKS